MDITINQWLGIVVGFLSIIPALLLFYQYKKIRIVDFLLFAIFFFFGTVVLIADPLAGVFNVLILFQIHHIAIDTAYLVLFIHAIRIIWNKPPKILLFIGIGWYALLELMTMLWQKALQPESISIFGFSIPHSFSSYFPEGASFIIGTTTIYSTAFRIPGDLYRIFALLLLIYAYTKITPIFPTKRIKQARVLWLLVWTMFLFHAISLFPWFAITEIVSFFLIIAGVIGTGIAIFIPEAMLYSHAQIERIKDLYLQIGVKVDGEGSSKSYESNKFSNNSINIYLKELKNNLGDTIFEN